MIEQGYCEKVEFSKGADRAWYLPCSGYVRIWFCFALC